MIVISSVFEEYKKSFDQIGLPYHFHNFDRPLDSAVWDPKVIILSPEIQDLYAIPLLTGNYQRVLLFTKPVDIMLGNSINYLITVGSVQMNQQKELHLQTLESSDDLGKLRDLLKQFTKVHQLLPDSIYIIGGSYRPGVPSFISELEENYIDDCSDNFDLFVIKYLGNFYIVVGVPLKDTELCHCIAEKHRLKLVSGRPYTITENGTVHFPLSYSDDSVYTLENMDHNTTDLYTLTQTVKNEMAEQLEKKK